MANPFEIGNVVGDTYQIIAAVTGEPRRGLYRARSDGGVVILSTSAKQNAPLREVERQLALEHPRIAKLREVRRLDTHGIDVLVENEPGGAPLSTRTAEGPRSLELIAPLIIELARISLNFPQGLGGLRPELIFVDDAFALVGVAPRCENFWRTARDVSVGIPMPFSRQYQPAERWADKNPSSHAVDAFSLAAILAELVTGTYPFSAGALPAQVSKIMSGVRPDLPSLPPRLRDLVVSAFDPNPKRRPPLEQLLSAL